MLPQSINQWQRVGDTSVLQCGDAGRYDFPDKPHFWSLLERDGPVPKTCPRVVVEPKLLEGHRNARPDGKQQVLVCRFGELPHRGVAEAVEPEAAHREVEEDVMGEANERLCL